MAENPGRQNPRSEAHASTAREAQALLNEDRGRSLTSTRRTMRTVVFLFLLLLLLLLLLLFV